MVLVNGAVSETIAVLDRGLAYGDGVFRTLRVRGAKPRAWQHHYSALARDCSVLDIPCPPEAQLASDIAALCIRDAECAVKIVVTRGAGLRGYAVPARAEPTRIVMSFSLPQHVTGVRDSGIRAHLCSLRLGFQPALAGVKHLNRLENVLARQEWKDPAIAEGLLLDCEGNVIGGTMSNVFIVEGGALATPRLDRCGVAGVTRERILAQAARRGIACRVERIAWERLLRADEVFVVNSLIGVWPISELPGKVWASTPAMAARITQWLDEESN